MYMFLINSITGVSEVSASDEALEKRFIDNHLLQK